MYRCCALGSRSLLGLSLALLALTSSAQAQLPQARLYAVYPPGAKAGATLDVTVTNGVDLDEIERMIFSHPGITAKQKSGSTFTVAVAADVPPGVYEARVHGLYGTSNPRCFVVGSLPEVNENDANNNKEAAMAIELGSVINGKSNGGADLDFYKFNGKKGQRVLFECSALRIDSRFQGELRLYSSKGRRLGRAIARALRHDPLLDVTLPEDGEYFLRVSDFVYGGSNDHNYRIKAHTGPYIDYVVPAVGVPGQKSKHTLYGRNLPGGQPAGTSSDGRQLQKLDVEVALPATPDALNVARTLWDRETAIDGISYVHNGTNGISNPVTIGFAPTPATVETEPNGEPAQSQKLTVPVQVTGAFGAKSDVDHYEFEARAGQILWVEVFAQRQGSLADPLLTIDQVTKKDDGTETLSRRATVDDTTVNAIDANMFDTNHDDVTYRFQVPADSIYRVTLRDRYFEARGAPDLVYHLSIREEDLDYRLVVIPPAPLQNAAQGYQSWAPGLRMGENLHVQVVALKRHGFNGVIELTAENLPAGVTAKGASIGPGQNNATMIFTAAEDAKPISQAIRIVGKSRIEPTKLVAAVTAVEAKLKTATDQIPKLTEALAKATDPLKKAETDKNTAEATAKTDATAAKTATDAKAAADKKLATAQAVQKAADAAKKKADLDSANATKAVATADAEVKKAQDALNKDKENQNLKTALTAAQTAKTNADAVAKVAANSAKAANTMLQDAVKAVQVAQAEQQKAAQALKVADAKSKTSEAARVKAVQAYNTALANYKKADDAKKAADAAVATAQKELDAVRKARDAGTRNVARNARTATIVWNGSNQQAAVTRMSRNLTLSVMGEAAPYQVTTDIFKETLSHNQQLLIPVKLAKREGFDNKITINVQNLPKNVQFAKQDIDKGKNEALMRLFVPTNVAEGTYTLFMQCQGQVSYQKNKIRLARATEAQKVAVAALTAATEAQKKATTDAGNAAKAFTTATNAAKAAQQALDAEKKKVTTAQAAEKQAATPKATADKTVTDAQGKVDAATKSVEDAKKAVEADKENADLQKKAQEAEAARKAADEALKKAQAVQADAGKKLTTSQAATKAATATQAAAQKKLDEAQAALKKADEAKKAADAAKTAADAKVKEATTNKTNADKEHKAATDYAKAKNVNWFPPSTPIVIKVRKGGFTLAANVPNSGNVKKGQKLEVKVTAKRINGFTGPISVSLPVPPGWTGLSAQPVTIPADKTEATLVIAAAGDAKEGKVTHLAIRGSADWNGPSAADAPVNVTVQK